jgi:hypothetical protein
MSSPPRPRQHIAVQSGPSARRWTVRSATSCSTAASTCSTAAPGRLLAAPGDRELSEDAAVREAAASSPVLCEIGVEENLLLACWRCVVSDGRQTPEFAVLAWVA